MNLVNDVALALALLFAWLCALLNADEVTLNVLIPYMIGSYDWLWYFIK